MRDLLQDIRYAVRSLAKQPSFTAVVVLILGLGIGINTTIFIAANTVLFRPLPYEDPSALVEVGSDWVRSGGVRQSMSYPDFASVRSDVRAFAAAGAYTGRSLNLASSDGEPERITGQAVSASLFPLLGIRPQLGRTFHEDDDRPGAAPVVLLGDGLWRRRFNADPGIVGRTLTLNGVAHTVIGVMPPKFAFPEGHQIWTTLRLDATQNRGNHYLQVAARLAPGVTRAQAQDELQTLMRRLEAEYPESNTGKSASIAPLHDRVRGDVGTSIYAMLGAVGFVMLIACANVANLLLVRGAGRGRELAVRAALGAGRWRIVRQLMVESVLLAVAGAGLGVVLAAWGNGLIDGVIPADRPWWIQLTFDWRVLAFTAGTAVVAGVASGIWPALHATGRDLSERLKDGSQGAGASLGRQRLRSGLVVAEIALSVVLLAGAGLMVRTFLALQNADPGFDRHNLLTAAISMSGPAYDSSDQRVGFLRDVVPTLAAVPGVTAAGATSNLPLGGSQSTSTFEIEGHPVALGDEPEMEIRGVMGDAFRAMGMPILRGRAIRPEEALDTAARVVVINATAAERLFPGAEALGQRVRFARDSSEPWLTIVGVVGDVRGREVDRPAGNQIWFPYVRVPWRTMTLLARTAGAPQAAIPAVRTAIGARDPSLPVYDVYTMDYVFAFSFWERKLFSQLFGTFGLIALVLASVGLYSVIAYSVSQRTREIGVRMALGAGLRDVARLVVGGGLRLTLIGIVVGALASMGTSIGLRSLLYGVSPRDPLVLAGVAVTLALVALAASWLPARRAMRVDPMQALRYE